MFDHIQGHTTHARRGSLKNAFRYGVDFILFEWDSDDRPWLLGRNRFNLWSLQDRRHGGARGAGSGVAWFRDILKERRVPLDGLRLLLLTQPSFLGIHFNPVSFWIAEKDGQTIAFVAEVNNTFGHRHCYFCANDGLRPIEPSDMITADKLMHVSPFQKVEGRYRFNFGLTRDAVNIRIGYENGTEGVIATLAGKRRNARSSTLLWAAIRRPFGAGRVVALIYWQALILWIKKAPFLRTPPPPDELISDCEAAQTDAT